MEMRGNRIFVKKLVSKKLGLRWLKNYENPIAFLRKFPYIENLRN